MLVPENRVAFHAGLSGSGPKKSLNAHSIGFAIDNDGKSPYTEAQMHSVTWLVGDIQKRRNIKQSNIVGHSDIAPTRKDDPGAHFPWKLLSDNGLGFVIPSDLPGTEESNNNIIIKRGDHGAKVSSLQKQLHQLGYNFNLNGRYDNDFSAVVGAFKMHWAQEQAIKKDFNNWYQSDQKRLEWLLPKYIKH